MVRLFMFLLRFMRDRGALIGDGEFRALWVALAAAYVFITVDLLAGAVFITIRRSLRRAAELDAPPGARPRPRRR
jgi:hypothetical protein